MRIGSSTWRDSRSAASPLQTPMPAATPMRISRLTRPHARYVNCLVDGACAPRRSRFFQSVLEIVAGCAVILVWQKFAAHGDPNAVTLRVALAADLHIEIDRRHDA